jgi:phosphate transport system substrate-binding protein
VLLICLTATAWTQEDVLPEYQRVSGVSGTLSSIGSDTLANLMTLWTEEFKRSTRT